MKKKFIFLTLQLAIFIFLITLSVAYLSTSKFTLRVQDSAGHSVTRQFTININPSENSVKIKTENLPNAIVGQQYTAILEAQGGNTPYTWTIIDGELPPGLTLNSDGNLIGIPNRNSAGTDCPSRINQLIIHDAIGDLNNGADSSFDIKRVEMYQYFSNEIILSAEFNGNIPKSSPYNIHRYSLLIDADKNPNTGNRYESIGYDVTIDIFYDTSRNSWSIRTNSINSYSGFNNNFQPTFYIDTNKIFLGFANNLIGNPSAFDWMFLTNYNDRDSDILPPSTFLVDKGSVISPYYIDSDMLRIMNNPKYRSLSLGETRTLFVKNRLKPLQNINAIFDFTTVIGKTKTISINGNRITATNTLTEIQNFPIISATIPECGFSLSDHLLTLVGDQYEGDKIVFVWPKERFFVNEDGSSLSLNEMMNKYQITKAFDAAYIIMYGYLSYAPSNEKFIVAYEEAACGGASPTQPRLTFGCIWNGKTPSYDVFFHELGHQFNGATKLALLMKPGQPTSFAYSEGLATIHGRYAIKKLAERYQQYYLTTTTWNALNTNLIDSFNFLQPLQQYESKGNNFVRDYDPNIVDGIFQKYIQETNSRYGWEIVSRFFSLFNENSGVDKNLIVPEKSDTVFAAGMSAAVGRDLRNQFISWNFPIDQDYYNRIYPVFTSFLTNID